MTRDNDTWLAELRAQDESALVQLREILVRNLGRALSDHHRADEAFLEDVAQDAVLRILDRLDQFQGRSRFTTWSTTIAIRLAMTELRRRRWRDVSLDAVIADSNFDPTATIDDSTSPSGQLDRAAIFTALHDAIQSALTEKQRTALLAELKGMPQDEIARHLGSNRNAVYKLTHDARKKLKQHLQAAGYSAADVATTGN